MSWAVGRLTITQAEASIAGSTVALRGEMSLQEPAADIALQWQVAGLHLSRVLGQAFQPVTIAEATGRLSQQGDALMLETSVQVPTFALAPGMLGRRQPQLTRLALTCTLQLPSPFTRLATEACRLHAAEAQLSLRGSAIDFGTNPQLALQVNGSLAGALVGALPPGNPMCTSIFTSSSEAVRPSYGLPYSHGTSNGDQLS